MEFNIKISLADSEEAIIKKFITTLRECLLLSVNQIVLSLETPAVTSRHFSAIQSDLLKQGYELDKPIAEFLNFTKFELKYAHTEWCVLGLANVYHKDCALCKCNKVLMEEICITRTFAWDYRNVYVNATVLRTLSTKCSNGPTCLNIKNGCQLDHRDFGAVCAHGLKCNGYKHGTCQLDHCDFKPVCAYGLECNNYKLGTCRFH